MIDGYIPKVTPKQLGARKTKEKKRVDGAFEKRKKSVKTNKKRKTTKRDGFRKEGSMIKYKLNNYFPNF